MTNYKKLYYSLFNDITDSIAALDNLREALVKAQQRTEQLMIDNDCTDNAQEMPVEYTLNVLLRAATENFEMMRFKDTSENN